jgi:hypothetical protein
MRLEFATEPLVIGTITIVSAVAVAAVAVLSSPENKLTAVSAIISISALTYAAGVITKKKPAAKASV